MNGRVLTIRGHHVLCVNGFNGLGYSPEFVENMGSIVSALHRDGTVVRVVVGTDDICAFCPHRRGDRCAKDEGAEAETREMDLRALAILGLRPGEVIRGRDIIGPLIERISKVNDVQSVCGNCRWRDVCLFYQSLER